MKRRMLTILLMLSVFSWAFPQNHNRRIEPLIKRLDQQLTVARDLYRHFPDKQSGDLIRQAEKLGLEGQQLFANGRTALARVKLNMGLDVIGRAINQLSRVPLERIQEQVEELLRKAEQLVPAKRNKEAGRLLQKAIQNRRIAKQAANARNYRKATEHYRIAQFLGEKSLSLVDGEKGRPMDRLRREKDRYEKLLESAKDIVGDCDDPKAEKLLQQAQKQSESIRQAIENGNLKAAQTMYHSTTRLLLRAIDMCRGSGMDTREIAMEELEIFKELLNAVQDNVEKSDPRKRLLVKRATDLFQQSRNAIQGGRYEEAMLKMRLGRNVLSKIWQKQPENYLEKIRSELDQLQSDIKNIQSGPDFSPRFSPMLNAASRCAQDAERMLSRGRTRLALLSVLAGNRFITAMDNAQTPLTADILSAKLAALEEKIAESKSEPPSRGASLQMIKLSENMASRANLALGRNELDVAAQYISLGHEILAKINN